MNDINTVPKGNKKMTKERKEILEKIAEKAFKNNKAVFDRLNEI